MIKIAVAEDNLNTYEQIQAFINKYADENQISTSITHYCNGFEISNAYIPQFDIILMDIDMPLVNGMSAAQKIRDLDPNVIIIFITNLSQYAIQGYSVQAFDYIMKPLSYFSFSQFFGRAVSKIYKTRDIPYYTIKTKDSINKIAISDIYYIEILNHTLIYHTAAGNFKTTGKLKEVESILAGHSFFRCNNGFLVNLLHVDCILENSTSVHGDIIPVSRARKKGFSAALLNYISDHIA